MEGYESKVGKKDTNWYGHRDKERGRRRAKERERVRERASE